VSVRIDEPFGVLDAKVRREPAPQAVEVAEWIADHQRLRVVAAGLKPIC
jgi:hypothetical protein